MKEESNKSLKAQVVFGLVWRFGERIIVQLIAFCVQIVLARILMPEDFGVVALVTVFVSISTNLAENGFGNALIQKADADELDYSSVFYFGIFAYIGLYGLFFFAAPYIAAFYENEILTPVLRVMGLRLVVAAFNLVQYAHVHRHLLFRKYFASTLIGTIVSAIIAFAMAYSGFGVWALVEQMLVSSFVNMLVLWVTVKWRPKKMFSWSRLKALLSYGWKLMFGSLLNTIYDEIRSLIIGRVYSPEALAYYSKGNSFPGTVTNNVTKTIESVLFPALSIKQNSPDEVKNMTRRSIKISAYLTMPLMFGLVVVARPLILVLLTEKWLPCVPFLQVICVQHALMPMQTANLQAIKALGRSDLFLKLQIIKKGVGFILLFASVPFGVLAIAISGAITSFLYSIINAYPNSKLLGYGYLSQLRDLATPTLLAVGMAIGIFPIQYLPLAPIAVLVLQVLAGIVLYILFSIIFKIESFQYLLKILKQLLGQRLSKPATNIKPES